MKKTIFAISLLLIAMQLANGQSAKDEVMNLVVSMDSSIVKKDSTKIKSLLTDDFIGTIPSGESFPKDLYIRFLCRPNEGNMSINSKDKEKTSVRFYGNSAIVNRLVHVSQKSPDGFVRSFDVQRIEVCVQQQGRWYIASAQGTEVFDK